MLRLVRGAVLLEAKQEIKVEDGGWLALSRSGECARACMRGSPVQCALGYPPAHAAC